MTDTLLALFVHVGKYILASFLLLLFYRLFLKKHSSYNESRVFLLSIAILAALVSQFRIEVTNPDPVIVEVEQVVLPQEDAGFALNNSFTLDLGLTGPNDGANYKQVAYENLEEPGRWQFLHSLLSRIKMDPLKSLLSVYILILLGMVLNLLYQYIRIARLERKGTVSYHNGLKIVEQNEVSTPFSFARTIFLPASLNRSQRDIIIQHELYHIYHRHYFDVFFQESLFCLFWFNPVQWLIRKDLRGAHEFQADRSVLDKGFDLYRYQTIILEEIMGNHFRLANGFNQSFTKKRFIQMKQTNHSKLGILRKLLSLPFIFALFAAFSFQPGKSQVVTVTKRVTTPVLNNGKWQSETVVNTTNYNNGERQTENSVTTREDVNIQELDISSLDNNYPKISDMQDSHVESLDSIQRMIAKTLPIVSSLAAQKEPSKDIENMELLLDGCGLAVNDWGIGYMDLSEETRNSFTKADFNQLEEIMTRINHSISVLKEKNIDSIDSTYILMQQVMLSQELLSSEFFKKLVPEMFNIMGNAMQTIMSGFTEGIMSSRDLFGVSGEVLENDGLYEEFPNLLFSQLGQAMGQLFLSPLAIEGEAFENFESPFVPDAANVMSVQFTSDNQSDLANVAYTDADESVRLAALNKMTNQSDLANVAYTDADESVRLAAVNKMTNQSDLANVAYTDADESVRLAAVNKMTNQSDLANVAYTDSDESVRLAAVNKMTNQSDLANVAYTDADESVRLAAVNKMTNQSDLANVAFTDADESVRLAAVNKMTNQSDLANVAFTDADESVRLAAVNKMTNQSDLANVAYTDAAASVKLAAIERITTNSVLENIINNQEDPQVRKAAIYRLESLTEK